MAGTLVTVDELNKSVAFTGYRSFKLPFGRDLNDPIAINLRFALYQEAERLAVKHGFRYFLTGGAEGSDLMMAEIILELKKKLRPYYNVSHILCLPCKNHDKHWCEEDRERLEAIKSRSIVQYISDREYTRGCMQARNQYMVNTSCVLLGVFDGQTGGTFNTIEYARKCARKIITFRPASPVIRVEEFLDPSDFNWMNLTLEEPRGVYIVNKFNTDKNFSDDNPPQKPKKKNGFGFSSSRAKYI